MAMSLLDEFQRDIERQGANHPRLFRVATDVTAFIQDAHVERSTTISLSMYIAFRQPFHGGWVLWLGSGDAAYFTAQLPTTSFDFKAKNFFRLSLWTNNARRRGADHVDVTTIPDGEEVYVGRVTGLQLFEMTSSKLVLGQGNASRIEVVPTIDVESDADTASDGGQDADPADHAPSAPTQDAAQDADPADHAPSAPTQDAAQDADPADHAPSALTQDAAQDADPADHAPSAPTQDAAQDADPADHAPFAPGNDAFGDQTALDVETTCAQSLDEFTPPAVTTADEPTTGSSAEPGAEPTPVAIKTAMETPSKRNQSSEGELGARTNSPSKKQVKSKKKRLV